MRSRHDGAITIVAVVRSSTVLAGAPTPPRVSCPFRSPCVSPNAQLAGAAAAAADSAPRISLAGFAEGHVALFMPLAAPGADLPT